MMTTPLAEAHLDALKAKLLAPSNVAIGENKYVLRALRVSNLLWQKMTKVPCMNDSKFHTDKCLVIKTLIALTYCVDGMLQDPGPVGKGTLTKALLDAIQLLCVSNQKCLELHGEPMKPSLGIYATLCVKGIHQRHVW